MGIVWDQYPPGYRAAEVGEVQRAVRAGDCAAVIGLSGSGKSNLLGFLAHRSPASGPAFLLVDCNRLGEPGRAGLFSAMLQALVLLLGNDGETAPAVEGAGRLLGSLEAALAGYFEGGPRLCFLLDRFDAAGSWPDSLALAGNLRSLRDTFKFSLTYGIGTRRPLDPQTELAELFYGHTLWLGPLAHDDALWSARRDGRRFAAAGGGPEWGEHELERLVELSWGYPSLLRACCEAYSAGCALTVEALRQHPAVRRRVEEFWADAPTAEALRLARLEGHPLLEPAEQPASQAPADAVLLTAKENLLLAYLQARAGQVCEKDELVQAVWPEDVIFQQGVRDESLAQLVRRLRVKIEPDPGQPRHIQTVPGRGYLYRF
jgi:hypothetical protein